MNNFLFLMQDAAKVKEVSKGAVQGPGPISGQFFKHKQTSRAVERYTWRSGNISCTNKFVYIFTYI
jgi:hypothetical protein